MNPGIYKTQIQIVGENDSIKSLKFIDGKLNATSLLISIYFYSRFFDRGLRFV